MIIREEENFAEKATFRFNYARIVLLATFVFLVLGGLSFLLTTTVLSKWLDPRSDYLRINRQLIELEDQVDLLAAEVRERDRYIRNVKLLLGGDIESLNDGNSSPEKTKAAKEVNITYVNPVDQEFRKEFEEVNYEKLVYKNTTIEALQEIYFFPPVEGTLTQDFNMAARHYGVDIVTKKDEPIKAVADGTVFISSWTQDSGYVLGLQHKNELVSFYKHNAALLKQAGETVKAGDIIAIIGNSGEYTDGPHLHFELWYKGNPVDPLDFVSF